MENFSAKNELEVTLLAVINKKITLEEFLKKLLLSDLALPSATPVAGDGSDFQPILFDKNSVKMLAAFTDKERIGELSNIAKYCLTMNGLQVLRRIPCEFGLVLNPGHKTGLELSPEGIATIRRDLGTPYPRDK